MLPCVLYKNNNNKTIITTYTKIKQTNTSKVVSVLKAFLVILVVILN